MVISLGYLAFQIRQNTLHQRASMQQGRAARIVDSTTIAGDDAALKHHILPWPGYRNAWEMLKSGMQPDFRAHVDALAKETPLRAPSDRLSQWKKLTAEQAAGR